MHPDATIGVYLDNCHASGTLELFITSRSLIGRMVFITPPNKFILTCFGACGIWVGNFIGFRF